MSDSDGVDGTTIAGGTLLDIVSETGVRTERHHRLWRSDRGDRQRPAQSAERRQFRHDPGARLRQQDFCSRAPSSAVAQSCAGWGNTAEIAHGAVVSGGTLLASGLGSLIKIVSGAVVNGGIAQIGNGIVEIAGSSGENVLFLSSGGEQAQIADTAGHAEHLGRRAFRVRRFGALEPEAIHRPRVGHLPLECRYLELRLRQWRQHQRNAVHLQRRHNGRCHQDGRQLFGG